MALPKSSRFSTNWIYERLPGGHVERIDKALPQREPDDVPDCNDAGERETGE